MSIDSIKTHMNEHHAAEVKGLVAHYGGFEAKDAKLTNVTAKGLYIDADGKEVFVPFPSPTEEKDYKDAIIALCAPLGKKDDNKILDEIAAFKDEFNTILLASLSDDNKPHISYSPLLKYDGNYYIYISEVAPHCSFIKKKPDSVQVMFIEDESKSKTIVARKRLTYNVKMEFLPRDDLFNKVYDSFESSANKTGQSGGISTIRDMLDFHLVKIHFKDGRFVKGFGQAYTIDEHGKLGHLGGKGGMPHKMPHGHKPHH